MRKSAARIAGGVEILEIRGGNGNIWRVSGGAWQRDLFDRVAEKLEPLFGATMQIQRCSLSP